MESERILGQNHILRHFENAIRMGKISHAYIINGEEGSGKMNLAIHFAKALQCERNNSNKAINEDGERITVPGTACGQCKSCKQTDSKNQPDIKYITYEKSGIGVDEIREQINDDIDIKPYSSPYKIYIVPESEKMTVQAQNALLKTIEEPPEYAIIILLTTNADTFLQTILSRCVMLNIRPVKEDIIKNQLTSQYGVGDYEARVAATFSNGNPGKAIKLATSEEFKELNDKLFHSADNANKFANIAMPVNAQVGNISYVIVAIVGGILAINGIGSFTLGGLASFLTFNKSLNMPIGQVSQQVNFVAMALAGAQRIFELLDEEPEVDEGYVTLVNATEDADGTIHETDKHTGTWAWKHFHKEDGTTTYAKLLGDVEFLGVDFGYDEKKIVLHDIKMFATPGQKIAFVGSTGAGKTTITNLINRFYDIQDGKIRYDGININKIKKADLRHSLGMVLQDTHLFTASVKDNIRYGKLDATDEEVIEAAKLANADSFIERLPQGYDTVLTGDGANLSQGQRQLLSIARAAIADPPVLILDEATSSIDTRTEKIVQEGMDRLMHGRTTFVIAHRLSTIKNSDCIMVLEQGRIIERGSHDDLIEEQGRYYQLYTGNKA